MAFLTFDVPFFLKFHKGIQVDQDTKFWLYIERIMLHPPMLIAGYIIYAFDPRFLIPSLKFSSIVVAMILIYGSFILFDDRALKKEGTGLWLLFGMSSSIIGIIIFLVI